MNASLMEIEKVVQVAAESCGDVPLKETRKAVLPGKLPT